MIGDMRASPNPSGEQLVTDYLTRVAQQARHLPKGARMAFVGRTRALVERELGGPGALTDPGHVSAVLDRLGTPEDLVIQERTRIDRDWVKKRASSKEEGEAAAAALTGPRNRSLTPRRRLNTDTQTGKRTPTDGPRTGPVTPVEGTRFPGRVASRPAQHRPAEHQPARGRPAGRRAAECRPAEHRSPQRRAAQRRLARCGSRTPGRDSSGHARRELARNARHHPATGPRPLAGDHRHPAAGPRRPDPVVPVLADRRHRGLVFAALG